MYNFKSKAQIPANEQIKYICITADLPKDAPQPDEKMSNNTLCQDISTDFWLSTIYPNPASDMLQFDLVLPYAENINIQITDIKGNAVQNYSFKAIKGLNQKSIDIKALNAGQYVLRLEAGELVEVRKFMKL